ncbi:response regulator [Arthrobacter agilis]|uniref:response regulator n=1 Tax=Arthrobacter agilis TaxID=37921 RepID=UPI00236601EB|nr:response regulator [Arthrobacter agilis]WDF34087.1 response regulator [Arthrobacter agilis]
MSPAAGAAPIPTLVVDDDHEVAGIHTGFLLAHGAFDVVGAAHTGARALELADQLRPRLVLLDIHLPDMTGIDVLRALRNRPGEPLDVIAITAARELDTVRAAVAGGVLHYLVKPFSAAVLNQRLDHYIAYRRDLDAHATDGAAALDQGRIDQLLRTTSATGTGAVPGTGTATIATPKGLSAPTLDAVMLDLRGVGRGTSASDVADRLGMARVSARRYLEFLVSRGQARIVPQYGSAGRPEKFYVWTDGSRD